MEFNRKNHWETIYQTKELNALSWYQPVPETSLQLIKNAGLPKHAAIIDIGGGDSLLADHLLNLGYENITVLDISEAAIDRAKKRLGQKAGLVNWIVSDVTSFKPAVPYDLWHDRAAFHFLTAEEDIQRYLKTAAIGVKSGGKLVLGTFSEQGPLKCSGIPVKQYSEALVTELFADLFTKTSCFTIDHATPFGTTQNFLFCSFIRR